MLSSARTRVVIGIAAAVWFFVALAAGQDGALDVSLRTFSLAGSIVAFVFALYDKYLWRLKLVRQITGKPLVEGTWRGVLQSDYVRPGETNPIEPIPTVIRITQSDTVLLVTQFTKESTSTTEQGQLTKEADGRWRLSWLYRNEPRLTIQNRSDVHRGAAELWITGANGCELQGGYFTSRRTRGDFTFTEWSSQSFTDAKAALESSEFSKAKPFVKETHF
jgi:hypothetical protein